MEIGLRDPQDTLEQLTALLLIFGGLGMVLLEYTLPYCWVRIGADLIARIGADQELDFILFTSPPVDLAKALEYVCNGVFFNRLCTELDVAF